MGSNHRSPALHVALSAILTVAILPSSGAAEPPRWGALYFPNVELTTQNSESVRFYDLVKGKTVAIELFYTQCKYACPLETARLAQVQALLGDRMGRDVFFYSISIDPTHDTPAVLKQYGEKYHAGPGWTFLTGKTADIDLLSKKLGLYSRPDPENKDGHMPTLLIGNEATGQWVRGSALDNPKLTATMITNWVGAYSGGTPGKTYAAAAPIAKFDAGRYVFSTKCVACHSLGRGTGIGPDLEGITHVRDRQWLARYIAEPDAMLSHGDPIAKALFSKYGGARMPNLELTNQEIRAVIAFLDSVQPGRQ